MTVVPQTVERYIQCLLYLQKCKLFSYFVLNKCVNQFALRSAFEPILFCKCLILVHACMRSQVMCVKGITMHSRRKRWVKLKDMETLICVKFKPDQSRSWKYLGKLVIQEKNSSSVCHAPRGLGPQVSLASGVWLDLKCTNLQPWWIAGHCKRVYFRHVRSWNWIRQWSEGGLGPTISPHVWQTAWSTRTKNWFIVQFQVDSLTGVR